MKVVFHTSALDDLKTIHTYIARDSLEGADWTIARLRLAIDLLGVFPHVGRHGTVSGTRGLVIAHMPYIVVYTTGALSVEIVAIFHTRQHR